jgi:hypothetical protein
VASSAPRCQLAFDRQRTIGLSGLLASPSIEDAQDLMAIMLMLGWRRLFVTGIAGVVAALVWFSFYRDPGEAG